MLKLRSSTIVILAALSAGLGGGASRIAHAQSAVRVVADEGTPVTRRQKLNFTGGGIACVDNAGASRTDCTVNGTVAGVQTAATTATNVAVISSAAVRYTAPIAAGLTAIVNTLDPVADGALSLAAQPDYPRKLQVRIVDANSSISAGTVALVGVGARGQAVTQTINLAGGTRTVVTDDAYATLTSATVAGTTGAAAGDTISIGPSTALGLPATNTPTPGTFVVFKSNVGNANETVGTVDATAGTIIPTSVPDGARNYDFFYRWTWTPVQNSHTHTQQ